MRDSLGRLIFSPLQLRLQHIYVLEAALIGLFWIEALRFLVGSLYSRLASASVVAALDPASIDPAAAGVVQPAVVTSEVSFLAYMIALPLILLLLGRLRWLMVGAVVLVAAGRALMLIGGSAITPTMAASLVLGGGLVYIDMVIRHRAQVLPFLFILGLGLDQLFRATGNTFDPSWSPSYADIQIVLSILAVLISLYTVFRQQREARKDQPVVLADRGLLTFWGGIGLGGMLFLQLSLLALPNAIAGRASVDYTLFVPAVMAATLLPLLPWVRRQVRSFIALFDGGVRGWSWMLVIALLIVIGTRIQNVQIGNLLLPVGGAALVVAQFGVSLLWWWLVRPQAEKERNLTGLWLIGTVLVFALLLVFDNFTYEYAYVRDFSPDLAFLNNIIPPLLRGFRGMGLGVLLLGVFLAALPMVQTRRRIPWMGGPWWQSALALVVVIGFSGSAALAARPPLISGVRGVDNIRVGTYNIHNGYSEFFDYDLDAIARTIQQSGADVVLLQEVETGRMTSFGVDQALWLARRLDMDTRFYPTNEGLQGLAVLSKVEIVFDEGNLLTSATNQTGLQRVQIRPDSGIITLYNTRLAYLVASGGDEPVDDQEQQTQLTEIFAIISRDYPTGLGRTLIGGTFNNVPDSPLIERMRNAGFNDPFAGQPIEISATLRRTGIRARFDYLWVRPPLSAPGALVMDSSASDHRMVVIEVLIAG